MGRCAQHRTVYSRKFNDIYIHVAGFTDPSCRARLYSAANKFGTLMCGVMNGGVTTNSAREQSGSEETTRKRGTCRVMAGGEEREREGGYERTVRFKMPLTTSHTPLSRCLQRIYLRASRCATAVSVRLYRRATRNNLSRTVASRRNN